MNLLSFVSGGAAMGVVAAGAGFVALSVWDPARAPPAETPKPVAVASVAPAPAPSLAPEPVRPSAAAPGAEPVVPQPGAPPRLRVSRHEREVAHRHVPALRPPLPARQVASARTTTQVYFPVRPADPYGYRWVYQRVY